MFPKIFPTLIFIFLFAATSHDFFTLCCYFLLKFPAQNFQMFPKIFPILIFIFLFAATSHNFFTLCRYFLLKFPAQILLYISCFFYASSSSQRGKDKGARYWFIPNFIFLISYFCFLFLISYFCFLLADLLNLLQLLVIHQSKVNI